ncbi:MAG: hypothetical protein DRO67_01410 [Candidatus Asgardarchaeum californiense]|nr:MAG: hypothetical protein DRO67_01410 [Candidatus Asgardarchaeum californiense]
MRKRAQRRISFESNYIPEKIKPEKRRFNLKANKNWWVAVSLVGIFFLVLFLNTYFNASSGFAINPNGEDLNEKFYLSGPDPYYNMRLVEKTLESGRYPYYSSKDPLLNYPLGVSGGRAPLMNMVAIGFSRLLVPFTGEVNAIGYSMQFVPALFGALLIFPVYLIGKTLFGKKEGLVAALFIAIIPIHIGSGHGSAYSLFDHDSFNLLLYFLTFLFLVKGVKEKDFKISITYALLSGLSLSALTMVWVEARFIYTIIALYAIVQMIMDIFTSKIETKAALTPIIVLFAGYGISLPVLMSKENFIPGLPFWLCIVVLLFGIVYIFLGKRKIPWIISIPSIFCTIGVGLVVLYYIKTIASYISFLSPLKKLSDIVYGSGIYGNKVSQTIAEAGTYNISRSVMSYGPVIYWLAWAGFVFLVYHYAKKKWDRKYLFFIIYFLVEIWLAGTAGRFLNDAVPIIALLAGWIVWIFVDKIHYKEMIKNIKNAGGGLRGLRKGVRIYHIAGVLFVSFLVILPNAFLAFDASIPSAVTQNGTSNMKIDYFGKDYSGAFGSSSYKEQYWINAYAWLNDQDNNIDDPTKRPAYISWWDYGFYESAVGEHPTVADNFQDGIPTAANFHTVTNEKKAVAVWIVRLLEGNLNDNDDVISSDVRDVLGKYIGINETTNITNWMQDPSTSPSYNAPIGEQYDKNLSEEHRVGEQYAENAYYHDIVDLLNNTLDDEKITWLYHDIQNVTGYSIRYYGVEGYDRGIFNIFGFLADKSIVLYALKSRDVDFRNPEDDFIKVYWTGYEVNPDETTVNKTWSSSELNKLHDEIKKGTIRIRSTTQDYKKDYFNTMFYKTYIGTPPQQDRQTGKYQIPNQQLPCYGMKHFYAEYISPYPYPGSRNSAVVIAKYFEGAYINGSISCNNTPLSYVSAVVFDKFGVPHSNAYTDASGNFSLLVPAGNITIQFSYANEVLLKEIRFNNTNDSSIYSPIKDEEAMRLTDDYTREINITVNLSTIEGFVYNDDNDNGSYDPGIDTPLSNISIRLNDEFFSRNPNPVTTDKNGHYIVTGLYPSKYTVYALENGFEIHNESVNIRPGLLNYNISKPKLAGVKGRVFFDKNKDGTYNAGEEMKDVTVKLLYSRDNRLVDSMTTDETGDYAFSSLVPGEYTINASTTNSTTGYYDYLIETPITLEENETELANISLNYAPIVVSGYTKHDSENVGDISIDFSPDNSIENNTAKQVTVVSDKNGLYKAELMPGSYNVSVAESGEKGTYSYKGQLSVKMGEGVKTFDISMTKESITVAGSTKHNDKNIANITIKFVPDAEIENNTAEYATTQSDKNGSYIIELMPGTYDVTVNETLSEDGQNVTYSFSESLEIKSTDISKTFDIILAKEET